DVALFGRRSNSRSTLVAARRSLAEDQQMTGQRNIKYERWQDEAWHMYYHLGEFRRGVAWKAEVVSRGRLVAAYAPDRQGDEPTPIQDENDPAVALVNSIAGGIGGQSELLREMTIHLDVPGEGW